MKTIFSLLAVICLSCFLTLTAQNTPQKAVFNELLKLELPYIPRKACYNAIENVSFIWQQDTDLIHIYSGLNKTNSIGGKGLDKARFQNLTDICLYPDGSLLALDRFSRKIKKFDTKGDLITQISLDNDLEPALITVSQREGIYVYDELRKEIILLDHRGRIREAFGGFLFEQPQSLESDGSLFIIYDQNKTFIFNSFGELTDRYDGRCFPVNSQLYCSHKYFFSSTSSQQNILLNDRPWQKIFFQSPEIILFDGIYLLTGTITNEKQ